MNMKLVAVAAIVLSSSAMAYDAPSISAPYPVPQIGAVPPVAPRTANNAPLLEARRARMEQMIAGMKARGVTKEQAQQSVNAFVANGKWGEARMVAQAFGLY